MKRVFHLFFLLLYVIISSGFTTSKHVCKGNSSELHVGLKNLSDMDCPKCSTNKEKNHGKCCKLEVKKVYRADNLTSSHKNLPVKFLSASIPYHNLGTVFEVSALYSEKPSTLFDFAEDHFNYPSLYILHCVYRI